MLLKEAFEMLGEAANKSLARIQQHIQDRNIGIITAHRSVHTNEEKSKYASELAGRPDHAHTSFVNTRRNTDLMGHIRNHGYGFVHIRGKYIENKGEENEKHGEEHSFLVIGKKGDDGGKLKKFLTQHGEKYGQDSILHKAHNSSEAHLIGTRDGEWLKKGEHLSVGQFQPNMVGDYHSALRRGTVRKAKEAFSVSDHNDKDVAKFDSRKEADKHLASGLKDGSLEKGSKVKLNARAFAFADPVGPKLDGKNRTSNSSFNAMSKEKSPSWRSKDYQKEEEEIETPYVFEDFNFWEPTSWFNRVEKLWVPTDKDLEDC